MDSSICRGAKIGLLIPVLEYFDALIDKRKVPGGRYRHAFQPDIGAQHECFRCRMDIIEKTDVLVSSRPGNVFLALSEPAEKGTNGFFGKTRDTVVSAEFPRPLLYIEERIEALDSFRTRLFREIIVQGIPTAVCWIQISGIQRMVAIGDPESYRHPVQLIPFPARTLNGVCIFRRKCSISISLIK